MVGRRSVGETGIASNMATGFVLPYTVCSKKKKKARVTTVLVSLKNPMHFWFDFRQFDYSFIHCNWLEQNLCQELDKSTEDFWLIFDRKSEFTELSQSLDQAIFWIILRSKSRTSNLYDCSTWHCEQLSKYRTETKWGSRKFFIDDSPIANPKVDFLLLKYFAWIKKSRAINLLKN